MSTFQQSLFFYIIIIFSAIVHEYAHGWMAYQQGDPTAKYAGRLTLNPFAHMDFLGTVFLPILLLLTTRVFFAYAKPVPINPNNFRNQRRGLILVSFAGPASNLIIALILGMIVRFSLPMAMTPFLAEIVLINIWLFVFNLIPVPPLDGSKLLFGLTSGGAGLEFLRGNGSWIGIVAALAIAFYLMPYITGFIFQLIVGKGIVF